ncbi:Guanine nucleotide-binding protein alpha-4 subunit [Psilocybe cubensis]|uniref:Guanine nucleotide-binding protein alpha-4 subunit n=2 Tax=Psilocybe cubensis TaxID=181762 RepID=A0ACB8GH70_PSICU|nr:Guanine nucleotide-binding protein alpha-4 subunit [Psilocybe cubensis]KAH9475075.1 Guanine nucleotide-binding protein alpha-4 subunit [Psilocybe cubensis]
MKRSKEKSSPSPTFPPLNPYSVARWSGATDSETEEEARLRLQAMQDAINVSRGIDIMLQESKRDMERRRKGVKILLLGQSESGKSSVLKNFQLAFAPRHFESERPIWKIVIQLNIIGSIKTILEALREEYEPNGQVTTPIDISPNSPLRTLRRMTLGLSPLFFIETNLLKILSPESTDSRDMSVRAGNGWKALLKARRDPFASGDHHSTRRRSQALLGQENDPSSVLLGQRDDIISLWQNPETQEILHRRRPLFRDQPGFFMDDIARIITPDYVPTDRDIIRARLRTTGIEEYRFVAENPGGLNSDFYITDVGGSRSQRASWAPFFDDVQAILFLAPLAFNQMLDEDRRVNRLEDSLWLWKDICSNRLLQNANLILFFNKRDVLAATLAAGVKVKKFVPTYGDLPNDVPHVTKYFKEKFRFSHKRFSPDARPFICHETSAIDIKAMTVLLTGVREAILRQHLRNGDML